MSNINNLKPIQTLKPFTKFCCSIGALPASYLASLSYEEQLLWLCNYLQETVIPTVNNNGEAITELQELYVTLKNYVDNYFTNLDVQNEIDTKLDEMATDGTLDTIINQQIFGQINSDINTINNELEEGITLMIGDSYAEGHTVINNNITYINGWCEYLKQYLNISDNNFIKMAKGGAGFIGITDGNSFINLVQEKINTIADKTKIKRIIIAGGINDYNRSGNSIYQAIQTLVNYLRSQFINSINNIFIFSMGYNNLNNSQGLQVRKNMLKVTNSIIQSVALKCKVFTQASNCLKQDDQMSSDGVHPNESGYQQLGQYMANLITTGTNTFNNANRNFTDPLIATMTYEDFITTPSSNNDLKLLSFYDNDTVSIYLTQNLQLVFNTLQNWNIGSKNKLGMCNRIGFKNITELNFNVNGVLTDNDNNYIQFSSLLTIDTSGNVYFTSPVHQTTIKALLIYNTSLTLPLNII